MRWLDSNTDSMEMNLSKPKSQQGLPCGSAGKESVCNAGDLGSIPGLEKSPGEGKDYPLQYSGLENSMHNHDDVITHLESDILDCEWALGGITMNKASGGDGIPVELFQILKDDL